MENVEAPDNLRPLTHLNGKTGLPFTRDPDVKRQIVEALVLAPDALRERVLVRERSNPQFLREECLVYLIREYAPDGKMRRMASDISEALLSRIEGYLASQLRRLGVEHAEEAGDEVIVKLFARITDQGSDLGDFAQVNFWSFLAAKISDAYRKHLTQLNRERSTAAPSWVHGMEMVGDMEAGEQKEDREPVRASGIDSELLNEELLSNLGEPHLTAMKLNLAGWPIESKKPGEPTISGFFGKTPRTINNWLRAAEETLRQAMQRDEL